MNKKVIITLAALAVLVLGFFGMKAITGQKTEEGNKTINIEIVSEVDNLNEKYEINTDSEVLLDAIKDKEGFTISNGMLMEVGGVDLTGSDSEYWHIYVNGEGAQVGVGEQAIKDGDTFKFERKSFK